MEFVLSFFRLSKCMFTIHFKSILPRVDHSIISRSYFWIFLLQNFSVVIYTDLKSVVWSIDREHMIFYWVTVEHPFYLLFLCYNLVFRMSYEWFSIFILLSGSRPQCLDYWDQPEMPSNDASFFVFLIVVEFSAVTILGGKYIEEIIYLLFLCINSVWVQLCFLAMDDSI